MVVPHTAKEPEKCPLDAGVWVSLTGDDLDLTSVEELLKANEHVRVRREDDVYFLTAPELEALSGDAAKRDRAIEIIELVNGAAQLRWSNHRAVAAGPKVVTIESDGRRHEAQVVRVGPAISRGRVGGVTVLIDGVPVPPAPPSEARWAELALRDEHVAAVLRILADPDVSWTRLSNVLEFVSHDGGHDIISRSASDVRLFDRTANNYLVVADEARHGPKGWQPPSMPMELGTARELVKRIAREWLDGKLGA